MHKDIMTYLNLYEVSSLQIQEKSKTSKTYEMEVHLRSIQNITETLDTPLS